VKLTSEQRGTTLARIAEAVFANCAAGIFEVHLDHGATTGEFAKRQLEKAAEFSITAASTLVNFVVDNSEAEGP